MKDIEDNKIFVIKFCLQTTHQPSNKIKKIISPTWDVVNNTVNNEMFATTMNGRMVVGLG